MIFAILVSTPACIKTCLSKGVLNPTSVQNSLSILVLDEADLLFLMRKTFFLIFLPQPLPLGRPMHMGTHSPHNPDTHTCTTSLSLHHVAHSFSLSSFHHFEVNSAGGPYH
ncbi:hypothetical protein CsSME_00028897 [Camellia sinensis var. sinensis]